MNKFARTAAKAAKTIIEEAPFGYLAYGHISEKDAMLGEHAIERAVMAIEEALEELAQDPREADKAKQYLQSRIEPALDALYESNRTEQAERIDRYSDLWKERTTTVRFLKGMPF